MDVCFTNKGAVATSHVWQQYHCEHVTVMIMAIQTLPADVGIEMNVSTWFLEISKHLH